MCDRINSSIHGSGAAGARRIQILGDGTPSSRFRQHTVDAWRLQSHFELHPPGEKELAIARDLG